jgi:hypothetical protein
MGFLIALSLAATTIAVPGRANTDVSIAAAGELVTVVWAASSPTGQTDIFAATSSDAARTFGAPVRVNDVDGDARVTGEQPPRVVLAPRKGRVPAIVVVWTTKGAAGTKLLQTRSDDGGRTFSRSTIIPGGDAAGNRGWESLTVAAAGGVDALWLDHREMTDHQGHMSPQQSKLYFSPLDGSMAPRALTAGVCYCCKTAVASAADGAIYAAWRHVYAGNVRDIAFTASRDGGRTFMSPIRVSEDRWVLDGCPDDGPAIAIDRRNRIHIVWPTLVQGSGDEPTIGLFYAMSVDGRQFTARQPLPADGLPHHPQIAIRSDGTLVFAWDELKEGVRHGVLATANVDDRGKPTFGARTALEGTPAIYPAVATAADAIVVAWTRGVPSTSTIAVARVKP